MPGGRLNQAAEMRVHLRAAAGDVEGDSRQALQGLGDFVDDRPVHDPSSGGRGADMTMGAAHVALVAQVDLQRLQFFKADETGVDFLEAFLECCDHLLYLLSASVENR